MKALRISLAIALGIATLAIIYAGCSSGGSTSVSASFNGEEGGTVALFIADGPADGYEHLWIWVTDASLIPKNANEEVVTVFRSKNPDGFRVDLLDLRDQDFLLTIKDDIPPGTYEKIRLGIADIRAEGDGACTELEIKLPSGRIDINPRGGFEVETGETLAIRLDVDANKSIQLKPAGRSGLCIFRPVIFADIENLGATPRCPRILSGTIEELIRDKDTEQITGFKLDLGGGRDLLRVRLTDDTVIFDENGEPTDDREELEAGQTVQVRGRLNANGTLVASLVVIGDILTVKGTAGDAVDTDSTFPLLLEPGQELTGDEVTVALVPETLILSGCDTPAEPDAIQENVRAQVVGKFDTDTDELLAIAILLKPPQIEGDLVTIDAATGGATLFIDTASGDDIENITDVFLPDGVPVELRGDGEVSLSLLDDLLECAGREVVVTLDPDASDELVADRVEMIPETTEGTVDTVLEAEQLILLDDGRLIDIQNGAFIMDCTTDDHLPVPLDQIGKNDELTFFGFESCPEDAVDFYSFIVVIN